MTPPPNKSSSDIPPLTYRGQRVVRLLGAVLLTLSLGMFVAGQTVWRDDLAGPLFLLYWSWCFLLTLLAGLVALVDLYFVRRACRQRWQTLLSREFGRHTD